MRLIQILRNPQSDLLQLIINCCLLFCLAIIDIKKHKIYNHTIYFCFVVNFLYLILLHRDLVLICLIQSFICLAVLFLVVSARRFWPFCDRRKKPKSDKRKWPKISSYTSNYSISWRLSETVFTFLVVRLKASLFWPRWLEPEKLKIITSSKILSIAHLSVSSSAKHCFQYLGCLLLVKMML